MSGVTAMGPETQVLMPTVPSLGTRSDRALEMGERRLQIRRQQLARIVCRDAVEPPERRILVIGAEHQAAALLANIALHGVVAQHGHFGRAPVGGARRSRRDPRSRDIDARSARSEVSRPTIAAVCRAKLPVAVTTCSHKMSPCAVRTRHSPPGVALDADHLGAGDKSLRPAAARLSRELASHRPGRRARPSGGRARPR